jgi:hypothetical protein
MTIRNRFTIALLAGVVALSSNLVSALPARAGIGGAALADCNAHDTLTQGYTVAELRNALATMPASMKEYTDCQDVISRALTNALANGGTSNGSGSGSGGSFLPTPVIVVLVVLVLAAATFGAFEIRRRRSAAQ